MSQCIYFYFLILKIFDLLFSFNALKFNVFSFSDFSENILNEQVQMKMLSTGSQSFYKAAQDLKYQKCLKPLDRPFSCNKCNKSFSQRHHLIYHMQIHAGNKPFVCKVCNKSFRVIYFLNSHKRASGH